MYKISMHYMWVVIIMYACHHYASQWRFLGQRIVQKWKLRSWLSLQLLYRRCSKVYTWQPRQPFRHHLWSMQIQLQPQPGWLRLFNLLFKTLSDIWLSVSLRSFRASSCCTAHIAEADYCVWYIEWYANTVGVSKDIFIPQEGYLRVFISWLNLDFGFSVCSIMGWILMHTHGCNSSFHSTFGSW